MILSPHGADRPPGGCGAGDAVFVSLAVFAIAQLMEGDVAEAMLGQALRPRRWRACARPCISTSPPGDDIWNGQAAY
jgi:hypothetical protein